MTCIKISADIRLDIKFISLLRLKEVVIHYIHVRYQILESEKQRMSRNIRKCLRLHPRKKRSLSSPGILTPFVNS
jgi:hypothetical protein